MNTNTQSIQPAGQLTEEFATSDFMADCHFHHQGNGIEIDGPGTMRISQDGIELTGQMPPGRNVGNTIIRVAMVFAGILLLAVPVVIVEMLMNENFDGSGFSMFSYFIIGLGVFGGGPFYFRLMKRLTASSQPTPRTTVIIRAGESPNLQVHNPITGYPTLAYKPEGAWFPKVVSFESEVSLDELETRIRALRERGKAPSRA